MIQGRPVTVSDHLFVWFGVSPSGNCRWLNVWTDFSSCVFISIRFPHALVHCTQHIIFPEMYNYCRAWREAEIKRYWVVKSGINNGPAYITPRGSTGTLNQAGHLENLHRGSMQRCFLHDLLRLINVFTIFWLCFPLNDRKPSLLCLRLSQNRDIWLMTGNVQK